MEVPPVKFGFKEPAAARQVVVPEPPAQGDTYRPSQAIGFDPSRDLMQRLPGVAAVQAGAQGTAPLTGMEFKMLLEPSRFSDARDGVKAFRHILEKVVDDDPEAGGRHFVGGDELVGTLGKGGASGTSTRYVAYLDTPDFALNRAGFILRERSSEPIASAHGDRGEDLELTLKFRSTDRALAASKDVSAAPDLDGSSKFEMDVTSNDGAPRHLFSKSTKVPVSSVPLATLEDLSAVYPSLAKLGLPPTTPLAVVNGRRIRETVNPAGTLQLARGVEAWCGVSVWSPAKKSDSDPVLAEFSFAFKIDPDADPGSVRQAQATAERILGSLRREAADWASGGGTKTEYIYGPGNGTPED